MTRMRFAIPLHLDQYREALPQRRARGFLGFVGQHAAIVAAHVAPDAFVVFDFDLEHGASACLFQPDWKPSSDVRFQDASFLGWTAACGRRPRAAATIAES
jgi:hypothetical protein